MEVGIFFQHHLAVRIVNRQHVRAGAHRLPVDIEVFFLHARLGVEHFGFPRNRRKKRHRQPVDELRILAFDTDAVGVAIHHFCSRQREGIEIKILLWLGLGDLFQRIAQLLQADDIFAHQT